MSVADPREDDSQILALDHNPVSEGTKCALNNEIVLRLMKTLITLQQAIVHDLNQISTYVKKIMHWLDDFEGNDEEAAATFLVN